MSILVTGGAGYIGSHIVYALLDRGEDVVVLDDLSTSTWTVVGEGATFVKGNVGDRLLVSRLLGDHKIDAVIHCAGSAFISDSIENPLSYYSNNVVASCALIECCLNQGVENFIFSSSAAVYGDTVRQLSSENDLKVPASPYARSKLMMEWILEDAARVNNFRYTVLRYFNVAGADPKGRAGQSVTCSPKLPSL